MKIKTRPLAPLTIAILATVISSLSSSITFGPTAAFGTTTIPPSSSPSPDVGSTTTNDGNTVVGDNDTFRQFLTCMLDEDGDGEISEEEITTVLDADAEDPVIVEEGEIRDCFQPLYNTGTSPPVSSSNNVDNTEAEFEDSNAED